MRPSCFFVKSLTLQVQYELRKMQLARGLPAGKFAPQGCEEKTKPLKHTAGYLSVIL